MSYRRFVAPILATLPDGTFEVIVTGDTVSQGKPHPEPYQKAAAILGVDPAHTIAIEDSNTGARSAEAAGCTVLVVQNHVPVLPGERRVFVETLAGMTAGDLPVPGAAGPRLMDGAASGSPRCTATRSRRARGEPLDAVRGPAWTACATTAVLAVVGRRRDRHPARAPGAGPGPPGPRRRDRPPHPVVRRARPRRRRSWTPPAAPGR